MIDNKTIRKVIMLNKCLKGGSPIYENREAEGAVANFTTNVAMPIVSLDCEILPIQEGTGTPSPSNPRPISGTSALNVTRAEKNIFDISQFATLYPQYCTFENDVLNVQGNVVLYSTGVEVKAPAGAKLSATVTDITSVNARFRLVYTDGSFSDVYTNQLPFSLLKDLASVRLNWSTNGTFKIENAQIEINSTATTYEPYTGSTYTIALGQTVYGGTADVVGGVGSKNKTARVLNGTESWFLVSSGEYTTVFALGAAMSVVDQNDQICSHFNFNSQANAVSQSRANTFVQGTSGNLFIQVSNDLATTVEGFKSWLASEYANGTPVTYVAKTTPTEYTFTGQPINSLLGVNNVWTGVGNTKVTYKYKTGEGGSSTKKYLPIFYDLYGEGCRHL